MLSKKRIHPKEKSGFHPRNKHRERYDFEELVAASPELARYVAINKYHDESIDFFDPKAVKALNKALLKHHYDITYWDIPDNYLCPPIPGRADYIHYLADLLAVSNNGKVPEGNQIRCLDIGTGANCVYPIIGTREYGWSFVGTDIDPVAIQSAGQIIEMNSSLKGHIELRLQNNKKNIFSGIIKNNEQFDLSMCNPPFHASASEARLAASTKLGNLRRKTVSKPLLNFGGMQNELWCDGGEEEFVKKMIAQSVLFSTSCRWFTCLISKQSNLKNAYRALQNVSAHDVKTIQMSQGNKVSRILAWTFLSPFSR